jgi:death-on-curing protein
MEVFLVLNGYEIAASIDEQKQMILRIASSNIDREQFEAWLTAHIVEKK